MASERRVFCFLYEKRAVPDEGCRGDKGRKVREIERRRSGNKSERSRDVGRVCYARERSRIILSHLEENSCHRRYVIVFDCEMPVFFPPVMFIAHCPFFLSPSAKK